MPASPTSVSFQNSAAFGGAGPTMAMSCSAVEKSFPFQETGKRASRYLLTLGLGMIGGHGGGGAGQHFFRHGKS